MTYSSTHIFNVETKDFVHEGRCVRDHHCVAPRLTEGPHYDHPDCPAAKWRGHFPLYKIWIQPHIFNIKQYFIAKFERHLFPSMSLMSGNTFPWSCFSLTTGSNDRFSRISFLSWNNLGYFLHFKPPSLFRCSCSCSCYWASFQPLVRPLDVLRANRRPWQTREGTLQRGFIFNALFPVGGWLPCQGKEGYWVKHHLMKLLVHGRILQSKIILYGTKIVPPKDTCPAEVHIEVGWWPCQWFHQGTWMLCTLVRWTLLLGTLSLWKWGKNNCLHLVRSWRGAHREMWGFNEG